MNNTDYYVGLDMGTSSVGWAVTDTEYNLLRAKGKDMWGVRLFSEALTASDRRSHRTSRRNLNRQKAREGLLKELFYDEITKIDPGFFERIKESKFYLEDKETDTPFVLFSDSGYTDRDYYNDYPTIFHLISELISEKGKEPHDIRLVFLACLNIFKHRGHFLNETLSEKGIENIEKLCVDFSERMSEYFQNNLADENIQLVNLDSRILAEKFKSILRNRHMSGSAKKRTLVAELGLGNKNKNLIEIVSLICGLKATISNIFYKDEYDDEQKKFKLSFKSSSLDEDMLKIEAMLTQDEYDIICVLKHIHDWSVVSIIMGTHTYISEARVESYEKHKNDLIKLKKIYKEYIKDKYDDMFREMSDNSYSAYVGKTSSNKKTQSGNHKIRMQRRGAKCSQEDFYKRIVKDLEKVPEEAKEDILADIETNSFLPKQLTNENGVIPYQLHKAELNKILENSSEYLDFLNIRDESGFSVKEKIVTLFEFRIPYYVGPLYKDAGKKTNAWVVRKEGGRVYPWNFNAKIDEKKSAELFIERMVRHCTYLQDECALPSNSLKYERFRVLNELNNVCINGERIAPELKQRIYNEVFKKSKKKVSKSALVGYLRNNGMVDKDFVLSGFDGSFANSLLTYGKFREIFDVDILSDSQEAVAEDIIKWSTIYGDSKKFLREKISENYGPDSDNPILNEKQIDRVTGYKFRDWGKLSKEFLNIEGADRDTGEIDTILNRMWNENYNLMELLSNKFTYKDEIEKRSSSIEKSLMEIEYEDLEELYISAPVKRMTWQTLQILKEIYHIMGRAPKKLFVEMARSEEEKTNGKGNRKDSRKKRLEELYKSCKNDSDELSRKLKDCDDASLRSKKLYLYYLQKGKCMYSGRTIHLESLFTNDYDIDHIYPQSVVKDDSLENNLVLVERNYNNKKSDTYPLFSSWQRDMNTFWTVLKNEGFINKEKYFRLTRKEELSDDELANFVNRQLVETRQATKVIAELMKKSFAERDSDGNEKEVCKVVYAKAANVSKFRHDFSMKYDRNTGKSSVIHPELVKCRVINDFHHAQDAYLNIVVGNVYDVKFTQNPYNYIKEFRRQNAKAGISKEEKERYHMDKIFYFNVKRGDEVAWVRTGDNKSLDVVLKVMKKNTPLVTRMNYEAHGSISNLTIWNAEKAREGIGYISTKESDSRLVINKYGGYSTLTTAFFFLVEHTKKGKRIRTIEAMPLYLKDRLDTKEKIEEWCADKDKGLGLGEPSVRLAKIKMYSQIKIDGFNLCLTGKSGNALLTSNEVQLKLDPYWRYYIKKLSEYPEKGREVISKDENVNLYNIIVDKFNTTIYEKRQGTVGKILQEGEEKFSVLTMEKQVETLCEIMKIFSFENQGVNLIEVGGAKSSGKLQPSKNISGINSILLVNKSVTGIFESTIDLLKI